MGRGMLRIAGWVGVAMGLALGCGSDPSDEPAGSGGSSWAGPGGSSAAGGSGGESAGGGGSGGGIWVDACPVAFSFAPTVSLQAPRIAGEWHDFELASATELTDADSDGSYEGSVMLPPGLHAYKLVYDIDGEPQWVFDPARTRRKYVDGVENSAVLVADCNYPHLEVTSSEVARPSAQNGSFVATLTFHDGADASGAAPDAFSAEVVKDGQSAPVTNLEVADDGTVEVALSGLADGKHTLFVTPVTKSGRAGPPARLVFWVEAEPFDWQGALIYMVVSDRYRNGDPTNDPAPVAGADPRGDFQGGDLEGLRQSIAAGLLDELGVGAIWLTPFNTNPSSAYLASDGSHLVTGYHGYWPVKAREVDPRLGGADDLHALVAEAHAHGIRILMDFVINHVHEDHEYVAQHPDWFRTGCVCGTNGCDWTANALECTFTPYMPDIDHRVAAANQQFIDDAMWWLETFDLDGIRVDAVKHVEEIATRNLAASVREGFEAAGTRYFLMGETAMGWNDCADPCNDENYGTISKYVGPHGLDGQFDFVLYHGVSYRTFAYGDNGMLHADYWFSHGQKKWPEGAVMTPYIGSHDTSRFTTMADYRGQDGAHPRHIAGNQWSDIAEAPGDAEPYRRTRIGMSWLLNLPGAPLLYYGDEYGQWGGADPNNRLMWRPESQLTGDEIATLDHVRALGQTRRELVALRRGAYQSLAATEDTLSFARVVPNGGPVAIVALTRLSGGDAVTVNAASLGIAPGTTLTNALGGPPVTVDGGGLATITIPGSGAVVLTP